MARPSLLARPDLAARSLEGRVRARRYAATAAMQAVAARTPILATRESDAPCGLLRFGEVFDVLERVDGWAWGQARRDGCVGWLREDALAAAVLLPTHVVTAEQAQARETPDADASGVAYGHNALVTEDAREGDWIHVARAGWMRAADLGPLDMARQPEPAR